MRHTVIPLADLTDLPNASGRAKIGYPSGGLLLEREGEHWRAIDGLHHLAAARERGDHDIAATVRCPVCDDGHPCGVECIAH